jgi:hypothetical protein
VNEVRVAVTGPAGSGKSAVCGEIEIAMRAIGLDVEWDDGGEKNMTHADWQFALELYKPKIIVTEMTMPALDRERACRAAEAANMRFGQWVPQQWLDLFLDAYGRV